MNKQHEKEFQQLKNLLDRVEEFPVTSDDVLELAEEAHVSGEVIEYLESMPGKTSFQSREEVLNRFKHGMEIREEEQDRPREDAYDEDY